MICPMCGGVLNAKDNRGAPLDYVVPALSPNPPAPRSFSIGPPAAGRRRGQWLTKLLGQRTDMQASKRLYFRTRYVGTSSDYFDSMATILVFSVSQSVNT